MKRFALVAIIAMLVTFPVVAYAHSAAQPAKNVEGAGFASEPQTVTPTFVITNVNQDQTVTIQTSNFPASETFNVHMNYFGTLGIGGTIVDTINSGAGGTLTETFSIPAIFHGQYQIAIRLVSTTSGAYAYNWFYNNTTGGSPGGGSTPPSYIGYPTIGITDVTADQDVTIQGLNFPPSDTFYVRMNYYGTKGVAGTIVETITIGADGSLPDTTYDIPAFLHGQYKIAIRLESPTSGFYAYNWFFNNTTGGSSGGSGIPSTYTGYPTFWISAVTQNQAVQIVPSNFIPNDTYNVRMNYYGTSGYAGTIVDTITIAADGTLPDTTYAIPAFLNGQYRIAIQLESPTSGYYAYNWFYNNTTTPPAPAP